MSRLFPERLLLRLAPAEVCVARFSGFFSKQLVEKAKIACDPAFGAEPWQGALAALKGLDLKEKCQVTVVLSNHFVRYALVPWSSALGTPAEEDAYIRHHFAKIHGERAKGWSLRASAVAGNAPRLASAVDATLISEIKECLKKKPGVHLASVQPRLMASFNLGRGAIPAGGAWLVFAEPDRACIALHDGTGWRAVHSGKESWRALLDRERHRIEGGFPDLVLLSGASVPSDGESGGWQFRELAA